MAPHSGPKVPRRVASFDGRGALASEARRTGGRVGRSPNFRGGRCPPGSSLLPAAVLWPRGRQVESAAAARPGRGAAAPPWRGRQGRRRPGSDRAVTAAGA
eukprot:scaffold16140_cov104-Isochrysis_galbana.AAC.4